MKKPLIILTGPTAVGKTKLSISLAKTVGGEIISADSMQVYQKMNIGSAKITPEEMCGVPHYLIDVLDPREPFNVVRFQEMAKQAMTEIYAKGKIPILVGGTGFYIQAILNDIDFDETPATPEYRMELEMLAKEKGSEFLHQKLVAVDEQAAIEIHSHNTKRVIRALEFYHQTGRKISDHNQEQKEKKSPYQFSYFVLNDKRETLYQRIDQRVDQMLKDGLVDEVTALHQQGYTKDLVSMQGLGYKEILDYLEGNESLADAIFRLKRDTRHFAKRQLTWFKREASVTWIEKEQFDYNDEQMLQYMVAVIERNLNDDNNEETI